jgi:hypothetical protein
MGKIETGVGVGFPWTNEGSEDTRGAPLLEPGPPKELLPRWDRKTSVNAEQFLLVARL